MHIYTVYIHTCLFACLFVVCVLAYVPASPINVGRRVTLHFLLVDGATRFCSASRIRVGLLPPYPEYLQYVA